MNKTKELAALLSVSLLAACGGGGNSETGNSGGNNGGATVNLTADIIQETVCGTSVTASSAELLVHNTDWSISSRHKADSNGKISATIPATTNANISLISSYGTGADRSIRVLSYAQHPTGDLGTLAVPGFTQQGCECQKMDVVVSSPVGALNQQYVQLTGYYGEIESKSTLAYNEVLFSGVTVCRATGGDWPVLVAASSEPNNMVAGSTRNYDMSQQVSLSLQHDAIPYPITLNAFDISLRQTHFTENGSIVSAVQPPYSDIHVYNELDGAELIVVNASRNNIEYIDGISIWHRESQRSSYKLPLTEQLSVTVPDNTAQLALQDFLVTGLLSDNTNYNLGTINGFNTFYLYAQTTLTDGTYYSQSFFGPLQGSYPDEIVPDDYNIEDKFDDNAAVLFEASVIRDGDNQSYQQYLSSRVKRSKLTINERFSGEWAKFNTVSVQFSTQ